MLPTPRTFCTALSLAFIAATPLAAETLFVTTPEPTGEGSFQAALDAASASAEPTTIVVTQQGGEIVTSSGFTYNGPAQLGIYGNGLTLRSPQNVTLFTATNPSLIALNDMDLVGPGGFSLETRGDVIGPAGMGIFLDVDAGAQGDVDLRLVNVRVSSVAGHGIYVRDCGAEGECAGEGSAASINVNLAGVFISDVGLGSFDADGLRVDERGPGHIDVSGMHVDLQGVGADGMELDEGQNGDVIVDLIHTNFTQNGSYCDPAILNEYLPEAAAGEFREFEIIVADLPQPSPDIPDLNCVELEVDTYEGGSVEEYEYTIDVDDGFDIDEDGPGSIIATFSVGSVVGNFDEGYDFDEAGPGDLDVVFTGITGNGNIDHAIKLSEAGMGSVYMTATALEIASNGQEGLVVEEEDAGDLTLALIGVASTGNDGGELGIEASQDGNGVGNVYVIDSEIADGIETDGVTVDAD